MAMSTKTSTFQPSLSGQDVAASEGEASCMEKAPVSKGFSNASVDDVYTLLKVD